MNEAESKPMCILKHGLDKGSHLFKVTKATVKKIWELTPHLLKPPVKNIDLENINFFFGLVSYKGLLQIWDLRKRRALFSVDLGMPLYWAEVLPSQGELPKFAIQSRKLSTLHIYTWNASEPTADTEEPPNPAKSLLQIPIGRQSMSFNKPVVWKDKTVAIVTDPEVVKTFPFYREHPCECETRFFEFDSGVSLVKGFKSRENLLLVGTERKDLHLINSFTSTILASVHLAEDIEKVSPSNIPTYITSCDGDEDTGYFAVGTSTPCAYVIKIDFGSSDSNVARMIVKSMNLISPGNGTSQLLLHPNKRLIAAAAWDSSLEIFSFPDMNRIHKCVTDANQGIVSLHFITSTDFDSEDPEVNRNFDTNQDLVYLAAATPDGCVRVWNLSGW